MSLFSTHLAADGSVALYLEETDANLDLIEDVVSQVPMFYLAQIRDHSGSTSQASMESARLLDKVRQKVPPFVTKVSHLTQAEALELAQQLIEMVKFARAIEGKPTKLELVK